MLFQSTTATTGTYFNKMFSKTTHNATSKVPLLPLCSQGSLWCAASMIEVNGQTEWKLKFAKHLMTWQGEVTLREKESCLLEDPVHVLFHLADLPSSEHGLQMDSVLTRCSLNHEWKLIVELYQCLISLKNNGENHRNNDSIDWHTQHSYIVMNHQRIVSSVQQDQKCDACRKPAQYLRECQGDQLYGNSLTHLSGVCGLFVGGFEMFDKETRIDSANHNGTCLFSQWKQQKW